MSVFTSWLRDVLIGGSIAGLIVVLLFVCGVTLFLVIPPPQARAYQPPVVEVATPVITQEPPPFQVQAPLQVVEAPTIIVPGRLLPGPFYLPGPNLTVFP